MDTSWKNWCLTLGSATIATLLATGHHEVVFTAARATGDYLLNLIAPLGPR